MTQKNSTAFSQVVVVVIPIPIHPAVDGQQFEILPAVQNKK
jgi:hypothetical protein